jgi:glycosyltransferase involved in cell wall biosynthesis
MRPDVVIARSNAPMGLALAAVPSSVPLVFDADGLAHDERLEDSARVGARYIGARFVEAAGLSRAGAVIARSQRGREILLDRAGPLADPARYFVAPNGRDPDVYRVPSPSARAEVRSRFGYPDDAPLAVYLGSLGPKYTPSAIAAFATEFLRSHPAGRLVVATNHLDVARASFAELLRTSGERITIGPVPAEQVPGLLGAADVGICFVRASFSTAAVSPVKIGEYLLSGCPVVALPGVGDVEAWARESSGSLILTTDPAEVARRPWPSHGVERDALAKAARDTGLRCCDMRVAVDAYDDAIRASLASAHRPAA